MLGLGEWECEIGPSRESGADGSVTLPATTGTCNWVGSTTSRCRIEIDLSDTRLPEDLSPVRWRDEIRLRRDGVKMFEGYLDNVSFDGRRSLQLGAADWTVRGPGTPIESDVIAPPFRPVPGGLNQVPSWDVHTFLGEALVAAGIRPDRYMLEATGIEVQAALEGVQRTELASVLSAVGDIAGWWVLGGVLIGTDRGSETRAVLRQTDLIGPTAIDQTGSTTAVRAGGATVRAVGPGAVTAKPFQVAVDEEAEAERGFRYEKKISSPWQDASTLSEAAERVLAAESPIQIGQVRLRPTAPVSIEDLWIGSLHELTTWPTVNQTVRLHKLAYDYAFTGLGAVTEVAWSWKQGRESFTTEESNTGPAVTYGPPDSGRRYSSTDPVVRLAGIMADTERRIQALEKLVVDPRQVGDLSVATTAMLARLDALGLI